MGNDLTVRLFNFSVDCIKCIRELPGKTEFKVIKYQLVKSATSSGANYEEAQAGSSRPDFANKIKIALREMRESNYWLRVTAAVTENLHHKAQIDKLIIESEELKKILGAISKKTRTMVMEDKEK